MSPVRLGPVMREANDGNSPAACSISQAAGRSLISCARVASTMWCGGMTDSARPPAEFGVTNTLPVWATRARQPVMPPAQAAKASLS